MAFCPNCGAKTEGSFCGNCGTAVGGQPNAGTSSSVPPGVPPGSSASIQAPGLTENVASALCYLFGLVTGIIFLVLAPYNQNKTIRFHAFQAIFGHIAIIAIWIVYVIAVGLIAAVTHGVGFSLVPIFGLLVLCLWLYMMYEAYNNRKIKLPLVGDLAEKQA
jgi:uncharacterized membrane protein